VIDPTVLGKSLASAQACIPKIEARAKDHAGKLTEFDAQIVLEAAHRHTHNLRQLLATAERRTA
jgi:hypothetical protein